MNRIRELEAALMDSEREIEETRLSRRTEDELQKELDTCKRHIRSLQKKGPEAMQLANEQMARLRAEYSSLQKHALVVSMQNDTLHEELNRSKARNSMLKRNLDEAREQYRTSGGEQVKSHQTLIIKQVDEIDALKSKVKEREIMLRTQLELKSAYEKELTAKRKEVQQLRSPLMESAAKSAALRY